MVGPPDDVRPPLSKSILFNPEPPRFSSESSPPSFSTHNGTVLQRASTPSGIHCAQLQAEIYVPKVITYDRQNRQLAEYLLPDHHAASVRALTLWTIRNLPLSPRRVSGRIVGMKNHAACPDTIPGVEWCCPDSRVSLLRRPHSLERGVSICSIQSD